MANSTTGNVIRIIVYGLLIFGVLRFFLNPNTATVVANFHPLSQASICRKTWDNLKSADFLSKLDKSWVEYADECMKFDPKPQFYCKYVGVWESSNSVTPGKYRQIINDDGTARTEQIIEKRYQRAIRQDDGTTKYELEVQRSEDPGKIYNSLWAVQNDTFLWVDSRPDGLDINPVVDLKDDEFTLIEGNKSRTVFKLVERTPSSTCAK